MGQSEVYDVGSGSYDQEGRCLLATCKNSEGREWDYAAMTVLAEPKAAKVLHRLLDAGIRPRVDNEGLTALHYAAFAGSGDAVTALLRAKACCDAKAHGGITPLMLAALAGSLSCARLLWESGADVASVDEQGQTAATWVCLGCGEPPSRSGRHRLLNNGPEEIKSMGGISSGLHEALDRRRPPGMAEPWGGPDRRELLGDLVDRLCAAPSFDGPASPSGAQAAQQWMPILREASKPGPVRCGCFAELYVRLRRSQGLAIPLLGAVLCSAIHQGRYWGEQLCRMLLREAVDLPVTGRLPDGRSIVEKALDLGWDDVALLLFDRGASLDSDLAAQARALRAAVEGGHRELAKRLIGQWAEERDAWARPAAPEAEGLAECPVCFRALCEGGPAALVDASGRRTCGHFLCTACATELSLQSTSPRCPVCRQTFQPPPHRPPDPREDPAAWFAFFDEEGSGYLERQLLEKVLPAVVPVDAAKLEASLRGSLWREWDPAGEGRISRKAFCAERGLLRWLAEHLVELNEEREKGPPPPLDQDRLPREESKICFLGASRYFGCQGLLEPGMLKQLGEAEVLRAARLLVQKVAQFACWQRDEERRFVVEVLKSCGTSRTPTVEKPMFRFYLGIGREWIERCWMLWDRDKSGRISLKEFCAEGGLADMMLQQSTLAAAKRVVRRMELEVHDPAALVACCQQLVECAVGIRPEDAVESWPATACRRLRERASHHVRRCDLYHALGVRPTASQHELREAYLRRAKQYHPDVAGSCSARFQRVQHAWETLRDPARRRVYDHGLPGAAARHPTPPRHHNGFAGHGHPGASHRHWYEDLKASHEARRREESRRREPGAGFQTPHAERLRRQTRHFEEVMREVGSNPDMKQFVGAGLQIKLLCQLGFILAAMLNLLLWAFAKQQKSRGSSRPPTELDRVQARLHALVGRRTTRMPAREEFEEVLSRGVQQVVLAMQRNNGSAKLFAWGCRALAALVVRPPAQPADSHTWSWADNDYGNSVCGGSNSNCNASQPTLEKMFILLDNSKAATANESGPPMANDVPLWLFIMRQFLLLVPREDPKEPNAKSIGGPLPIAPGALREAGTCALATMRHLCDHTGPEAGNAALEELLAVLKKDERGSAALLAWVSAAVAALAADGRALAEVAVQATATGTSAPNPRVTGSTSLLPSLSSLLTASARGLKAAGPVRPPSSPALAAGVATGLLSGLRRIPATARNGAGGGTTTPAGDGSTRGRVTLRDGHIAVGDVVRLHNDLERAKREQEPPEHFGGWCDRMAFCLDFPGRVVEIPRRSPRMPEVLRISHGALGCWCWNAKAVAEVISDAGLLPFEEDECGPGAALTIGDEVRIDVTVEEAKQLQVNHGGWNDRMTQCCGRVGRLEAIDKAGDMKVLVPGAGAFVWNPRALRSLHAQRWESALCERLCGPCPWNRSCSGSGSGCRGWLVPSISQSCAQSILSVALQ
ncbi:dnaJ [Symbiodinium sp. CCMP2592]|nr:dnaJ [Symbiodinium sp. CCMP2592]